MKFRVRDSRFRVWGFGFRVSGFEFQVQDPGSRISGSGFRVWGLGFRASGFEFRDSGCRVLGLGRPGTRREGARGRGSVARSQAHLLRERDWNFIAEQPHLAHPERYAALRIVLVTVPRVSRSCELLRERERCVCEKERGRVIPRAYVSDGDDARGRAFLR